MISINTLESTETICNYWRLRIIVVQSKRSKLTHFSVYNTVVRKLLIFY